MSSYFISIRVESELDYPDYLGYLFGGSSRSHLQIKLSGYQCEPDFQLITCPLEKDIVV